MVAQQAHNLKVPGSSPGLATKMMRGWSKGWAPGFHPGDTSSSLVPRTIKFEQHSKE